MPEATKPGPDAQPLVGASEAAAIMNIELSTFSHLRKREEQIEGSKFPKPLAILRCGPIWKTADIKKFATRYVAPRPGPKPIPPTLTPAKTTKTTRAAKTTKPKAVPSVITDNGDATKVNGKATVKATATVKKAAPRKVVAKKVPATV